MPDRLDGSSGVISLVGAGAVGSLLASALCHTGAQFHWAERNPDRREQLNNFKAQINGKQLQWTIDRQFIHADAADLPQEGLVILAVKAPDIEAVLSHIQKPPRRTILIVANGLLEYQSLIGLLYGGAVISSENILVTTDVNRLIIGDPEKPDFKAGGIIDLLSCPWLSVAGSPAIKTDMWHKLTLNCVVNPLSTILNCPNEGLLRYVNGSLVQAVLAEVNGIAQAILGDDWPHSQESLTADLVDLLKRTAGNSSSMREDFLAQRRTEIQQMNLAVARMGEKYGKSCPFNENLGRMVLTLIG